MDLLEYDFQNKAVDEIVTEAKRILRRTLPGAILLDAPTGAGKTVTAAKAIARLVEEHPDPLSFIWLAPNTLHKQSRDKLVSIYRENKTLSCLTVDELRGTELEDRSILFLNWPKVTGKHKLLQRDDETGRSLLDLLDTTRAAGRKIVLLVDESHLDVNGAEAQKVVQHIIVPDLTVEISATPILRDYDHKVVIDREDVVRAGVIRKQFIINPGMQDSLTIENGQALIDTPGSAEGLLDAALAHRKRLKEAFEAVGTRINPLVLIQFPDKGDAPSDLWELVEHHLLQKHGLSLEPGGRAAIWLADDKRNLDGIRDDDSPVEVLFFKQAVAAGWDCPRAQILVSLRKMSSPTFTAQVLGRILRQPEHRHYDDALLDSAYVFTNHPEFTLERKLEKVMATRLVETKQPLRFPVPAWREINADQRLHLTESAYLAVVRHAQALLPNIRHHGTIASTMVSDLTVQDIDALGEDRLVVHEGTVAYELSEDQLEEKLILLVRELVSKTAGQVEGRKHVRRALQEIARQVRPNGSEKQNLEIVLHPDNRTAITETVTEALAELTAEFEGKKRAFDSTDFWRPAESKVLPWSKELHGLSKYAYAPALDGEFNGLEGAFGRLLDANPSVITWLKNGDKGSEHFAIPYEMPDGKKRLFYPDFLAVLTDGRFGIWDTKGHGEGGAAGFPDTPHKAEALAAYRARCKAEGVEVVGGIVVRDNAGRWMLQDQDAYAWSEDLKGWKPFST